MSTDFSDSMDVTTWTRCCNVTTIMSLFFVHDHTIIDINTANEFQVKEDTDHVIVKGVDSIISNEVVFWIGAIANAGLQPLLFILGAPGNILCAAVFYKLGLRERINLCVFALALVDLATITFTVFIAVEAALRDLLEVELNFFIQYFIGPLGFQYASMFVSTTIACERCFCVVSPFKAQRYIKTSTTAVIITVVTVVIVGAMCAFDGPTQKAVTVYDPVSNTTKSVVYYTDYYINNREIIDIFDIFVYSMFIPLVAIVVTVITTAITAVKLCHAVTWRDQTTTTVNIDTTKTRTSSKEVALTKMLIATSILFIVCVTPIIVVQMTMYFVKELNFNGRYVNLNDLLWVIISVLRMLNFSLNFYIYYNIGSKFRETLREMLRFRSFNKYKNNLSQQSFLVTKTL
ncbi:probable G-protein coupled receptor frpr-1 [Pomacea canaliculata]|uniref:probable G-protein coupled receptor frpr-1 n=1 Tax=Pomacea canaliculata TaxID=400727 RepID=UPI000D732FE8|nr:probable G-protein coupled receptor frpr-1 [Pomacea canaliculata]